MSLVETLKAQMKDAMRAKDDVAKDVLRLALSEIQLAESRSTTPLDDDARRKMVRKIVTSNEETLAVAADPATRARLEAENRVLLGLLPKELGVDELVAALAPVQDALRAAKAEGPAVGAAMKHLKGAGLAAQGEHVKQAVARIRGA